MRWLDELEDALWVYVRNAPIKAMSANSDQGDFLFIVMLQKLIRFAGCSCQAVETGGYSAIPGEQLTEYGFPVDRISR